MPYLSSYPADIFLVSGEAVIVFLHLPVELDGASSTVAQHSEEVRLPEWASELLPDLVFFSPCCFVLYLTCFTLNLFLIRTLVQRAAKRAKVPVIVIEDEPTATAGGASETTLPDPATFLQSSPQRKYVVCFSL